MTKLFAKDKSGAIIIEGHVQGLSNTRSFGEMDIPVYVVDKTNCIARYSKFCKKFFKCPDFIEDSFADFLLDLAEREDLKGWMLMPSNDHAVLTISKYKTRLEEYYKVITPSFDIIQNIYDKSRLLKKAEEIKVPVPKTFYFRSINCSFSEDLPYPVITKGRNGLTFYKAVGKKAFIARDDEELKKQLKRLSEKLDIENTFTQEVIPSRGSNQTLSFTAFCVDGFIKTYWIGAKLREHPLRFGTATFCRSVLCEELVEPSAKLVKALNYTGVCEIEYLKDPRDELYKLIEINARTWLWVGLAKACGVNYPLLIYNFLNGKTVAWPDTYTNNIYWINYLTDIPYSLMAILKGKLNLLSYIRTFKEFRVNALWYKSDIKPFFAYLLLTSIFIKNR